MKKHQWILLILTILLGLIGYLFQIEECHEILTTPQHGYFDDLCRLKEMPGFGGWDQFYYYTFFIVDLIWAPALLHLLYRYLKRPYSLEEDNESTVGRRLPAVFFILACAAYSFDVLENISYIIFNASWVPLLPLKTIVDCKNAFYALAFLAVLIHLYQKYVFPNRSAIQSAIKSTSLSLLTIILLVGLATLMDQGSTVIVHLYDHPVSLVLTILLINLLALASGHYPDYIDKYTIRRDNIIWYLHPLLGKKTPKSIGLITYNEFSSTKRATQTTAVRQMSYVNSPFFNHFRKLTGSLVMITWLYVLLYTYRQYELSTLSVSLIVGIVIFLSFYLHFNTSKVKAQWSVFVGRHIAPNQTINEMLEEISLSSDVEIPKSIIDYTKITLALFLALLVCVITTVAVSFVGSWVITTIMLSVTTLFNIAFIIFFQQFRTVLHLPHISGFPKWSLIVYLGDDLVHVRFYALMGFATLFTFIGLTIQPVLVNALVLVLMFVFLVYGFIIVILKHHLYYSWKSATKTWSMKDSIPSIFFRIYVPALGFILLMWTFFNGAVGNGLHSLPLIDESPDLVTLHEFKDDLIEHADGTRYLVASYGGGLRASAWTMLLLENIQDSVPEFFDHTIAMSGASGGFLGLAFYSATMAERDHAADRKSSIDAIGKHNLLSIDISYLLGWDFVRELIPYWKCFCTRDRAGRSMKEYAGLIQPDEKKRDHLLATSYRRYWSKVYQNKHTNRFPALIGNTTGTNNQYGVAFSMEYDPADDPFPGAVDILSATDTEGKTISYLDATSTTERFPIFSPAAEIKGKGNFLDGGYFENSGLLSLMNFYGYLSEDTSLSMQDSNTRVIVFINSKDDYIRMVLGDSIRPVNNKATSELGAILETVTDVSILSLAMEEKYAKRFGENYIPVYLPYYIHYDDVKSFIGGTPQDPFLVQALIDSSNAKIDTALSKFPQEKDKPIPPALARVLSDPGYAYIKAMLKHEDVVAALERIR